MIVLLVVIIARRPLFLLSLDEELATSGGIRSSVFNILLVALAAITVSLSMRIVGILLIGALMVIPVLTAMQLSGSFRRTTILAVLLSLFSVLTGLVLSYQWNLPSGGTIVLVALALFLGSLALKKKY